VFGLQAAVDDMNKQGGVFVKEFNRKLPVRLVILDDQSDYIKAGTLAEDLILREKVNFLLTGGGSPPAFASIATVSQKYQMVYVGNMGPFEPYTAMRATSSPPWKYAWASGFHIAAPFAPTDFRYNKPGYTIVDVAAALIKQFADQTNKRTAIFASDEPDGRGWYGSFPAGLKAMGLDVLGADKELGMAPPNTTDFSAIIKQWKDYNCEIMFGNALAPWFGTLWRQSQEMGFKPKLVYAGRAALYYTDVNAWGGDLPLGIGAEQFWSSSYDPNLCPGIGGTTPQSLTDRWITAKNQPLNQLIGFAYTTPQILFDAIERAGTLDKEKVNEALSKTDLKTTCGRAAFDENNFCGFPLAWGQWFKTDKAYKWEWQTVISTVDFIPTTAKPQFPIPYK
jgi:branched-chain amino acid transport system substrate-binding protein